MGSTTKLDCPDVNISNNIDKVREVYIKAIHEDIYDQQCLSEYVDVPVLPVVTVLRQQTPHVSGADFVPALVTPRYLTLPTIERIVELMLKHKAIRLRTVPSRAVLTTIPRPIPLSTADEALSSLPSVLYDLARLLFVHQRYKEALRIIEQHNLKLYSNRRIVYDESDLYLEVYYTPSDDVEEEVNITDDLPYGYEALVLTQLIEEWP